MTDTAKANSVNSNQNNNNQCPEGCCQGNEILCISIPCPITIVLLGLTLRLELECVRLTSQTPLQANQVQQILQVLGNLLGNLLSGVGAQSTARAVEE